MDAEQIRKAYVLYIGAGAVAAGGIISMLPRPAADRRVRSASGLARPVRQPEVARTRLASRPSTARRTSRDRAALRSSVVLAAWCWHSLGLDPHGRRQLVAGDRSTWVNLAAPC